jgi:hypothetical protein
MAEENAYTKQLRKVGILDGYEYVLKMLCKYGLPKGNIFDFAAVQMMQFEKKWKVKTLKEIDSRVKEREEQKEKKRLEKLKLEEERKKQEKNEMKKFLKAAKEKKLKLQEEKKMKGSKELEGGAEGDGGAQEQEDES